MNYSFAVRSVAVGVLFLMGMSVGTVSTVASAPASLTVREFLPRQKFYAGSQMTIAWTMTEAWKMGVVDISIVYDIGRMRHVEQIADNIPNYESFQWTIPDGVALDRVWFEVSGGDMVDIVAWDMNDVSVQIVDPLEKEEMNWWERIR